MPEELLLFGPLIAEAKAQAERDAKFQAFCDTIIARSEEYDARPRLLSDEMMLRLEREYYADDGPNNAEELREARELQNKIHRATCPPSIREQAREIVDALFPRKI
ncbi:MAG: hypothetical protein ACLPND_10040 [Candidatus Korobacteraceae bacterium]